MGRVHRMGMASRVVAMDVTCPKKPHPGAGAFARRLRGYWRGIVSRVRWPMHSGQLEGINNKIKGVKRMACGYRDSDYFYLKI